MSRWVYIDGVVTVDVPGRTQHEKEYILNTVLDHLPKVTGSEGNMNVVTHRCVGYDESDSHDEFGIYHRDGIEIQNTYKIILYGDLRDRVFDESFRELNKFFNRLAKRLTVEDILVKIRQYDKAFIFQDPSPYRKMWEYPAAFSKDGLPAWWEYLMWDQGNDTWMPLQLVSKYYDDKVNDEEYERRKKWLYEH